MIITISSPWGYIALAILAGAVIAHIGAGVIALVEYIRRARATARLARMPLGRLAQVAPTYPRRQPAESDEEFERRLDLAFGPRVVPGPSEDDVEHYRHPASSPRETIPAPPPYVEFGDSAPLPRPHRPKR
jgi:hypothetical protein